MLNFEKIWTILSDNFPTLMEGAGITLKLAFFTVLFGTLVGLVVAIGRNTKFLPLRWLMNVYVSFIRGTPLLVQVLLIVYGLPQLGLNYIGAHKMTKEELSIIALVINSGAYMAEIIRAGLQSVDHGQSEAADSLGMSGVQKMIHIILPQAIKTILPTMGNEFVAIIKESSILYSVGVYELTYQANKISSTNFRYLETMIDAALIYFVLTYAATKLLSLLERRMRRADRKA